MSLRLALYSDQVIPANAEVNRRLLRLIGNERPRIGYISSAPDPSRTYFSAKKIYYAALGAELCNYVDSENVTDSDLVAELLQCDAIQLTGGDTYAFLAWLQARDFLPVLRAYANRGGVLIGTSAGSLLMSPNIAIALLSPHPVRSDLANLEALGLVHFHFWPHYQSNQEQDPAAAAFLSGVPLVYACPDGAGVIVERSCIETIGAVKAFRHGRVDA
jgi:dipeptidase E